MKLIQTHFETVTQIKNKHGRKTIARHETLEQALAYCEANRFNVHTIKAVYTLETFAGNIKLLRFTINQ